jgi:hypothetical protein
MKWLRCLTAFLFLVMAGVIVVDMQVNSLTHRYEFVQLFNLRRDSREGYSVYFFGHRYPVGAVLPIATIHNTSREFILETGGISLRLPTKINVNTSPLLYWFRIWFKQFVEEAHKTKAALLAFSSEAYRKAVDYVERCRYLLQGESSK